MIFGIIGGQWSFEQNLVILFGFGLAIMIALVVHEYAHGWMAWKCGDPTAKLAGRLSFNPKRHVDPLGLLFFLIVGIGWAKPVPVNPFNYRNFKRGNFLVSIAGVFMNLVMAIIASLGLYFVLINTEISFVNGMLSIGNVTLFQLALFFFLFFATIINIALMIFNLLPIPPLDGYNLLRSFTKPNNSFMRFMRENGLLVLIFLLIFGMAFIGEVRNFIFDSLMSFWGLLF